MSPAGRAVKQAMDVVGALAGLVLGSPLFLLVAVLVRISGRGPILFMQERAGRGMKPFIIYKFRTMPVDADPFADSPREAADPRLTRIGRFLREASLDELPQLWNVLKGDMSLVGPRPLYMSQARAFTDRQRRRLEVRPGLTGLAQIQGRGEIPHEQKLEIDVQYVEQASLRLDLWILWRSFRRLFSRKDVYQKW
jgi:lipopolysaccharide/colanic/teichoic acid biosynthesis glycosyltransferase